MPYGSPANAIPANKVSDSSAYGLIPYPQINANSQCDLPPQPAGTSGVPSGFDNTNICSIKEGAVASIDNYVYSITPSDVAIPIDTTYLPVSLKSNIEACDITNSCTMIGYDFVTDTATRGPAKQYIVSTQSTLSSDQAVLTKFTATSIAFIRVVNGGSGYTSAPNIVIDPPTGGNPIQATASATVSNGIVTTVNPINVGSGYVEVPTIAIDPPPEASGGQQAVLSIELLRAPVLTTPPGYRFNMDPLTGTPIRTFPSMTNVDACASQCDADPLCKGFNYNAIGNTCKLYNAASVEAGPTYDQSSGDSSFISEKYVSTQHADEQTGIIKTAASGSVPTGTDFTNQGSYCQDLPQCNTDIKTLVDSPGVQSFTTDDIQSCQYCPIRGFNRTSLTVTNEIGVAVNARNNADAIQKLVFTTNNAAPTYNPPNGVYSIAKWNNPNADIVPSQTVYISKYGGVVNNYNGVLGKNLWFDTSDYRNAYKSGVSGGGSWTNYYESYVYLSNMVNNATDFFTVLPVDYIPNGYIFMANGGHVNSKDSGSGTYRTVDANDGSGDSDRYYTCNDGGKRRDIQRDICAGVFKDPLPPKYSAKYNSAVYILTPTSSVHQFFAPFMTSKTYYHDTIKDEYYKISFSAPKCTQDFLLTLNNAVRVPQNYNDGRPVMSQYVITIDGSPVPLSVGDRVFIGDLRNAFTVTSTPDNNITFECPEHPEHPDIIPANTHITWFFIKNEFDPAHNNLMFKWYQEVDNNQWTEIQSFGDLIMSCADGDPMPDPYAEYNLFRTFPNTQLSDTGKSYIYNARQGCDSGCSGGNYLLYNCYVNSGAFYSSCDTNSNGAAQRGPICDGTYNSCTPDKNTQMNKLAKQFTGLTPIDNVITSIQRGNPQSAGLTTDNSPNYTNTNGLTMSTTYIQSQTTVLSLTDTDKLNFPTWMRNRLSVQTVDSLEAQIEGLGGCSAGYGRVTLNQIHICHKCDAGTYSPGGISSCVPCTQGNYCQHGSSTDTIQCIGGYFCTTPASQEMCAAGSYCPPGTVTPLLCASAVIPGLTAQTTLSQTLSRADTVPTGSIPVNLVDSSLVQTFYIIKIAGMLTALKAVSSTTFTQINPVTYSEIGAGTNVIIQTRALYCPPGITGDLVSGKYYPPRCPNGARCPDPSRKLFCNIGQYCSLEDFGVYQGIGCPAGQYYYPPSLQTITQLAAEATAGRTNTDGVQCHTCPPGTTVLGDQSGCQCPSGSNLTWSHVLSECIRQCPIGQKPNASNTGCESCPAGTYIDSQSAGQVRSCMQCATNYISNSNADNSGCTCTSNRSDGTVLTNGTTEWDPRWNRCKTKCNSGYTAFYSGCYANSIDATPKTTTSIVRTNATAIGSCAGYYYSCSSGTLDSTGLGFYKRPNGSSCYASESTYMSTNGSLGANKCMSCPQYYTLSGTQCIFEPLPMCATGYTGVNCTTCATGYTGTNCEMCATNYVWNGSSACVACPANTTAASAAASGGVRSCTCYTGYTGTNCEMCATNYVWNGATTCYACQRGGTAASAAASGGARSCTCPTGFNGFICENSTTSCYAYAYASCDGSTYFQTPASMVNGVCTTGGATGTTKICGNIVMACQSPFVVSTGSKQCQL